MIVANVKFRECVLDLLQADSIYGFREAFIVYSVCT